MVDIIGYKQSTQQPKPFSFHPSVLIAVPREKILKSTEEQELEKSLRMQQEVVEMRRKNEEFKKLALAGPGQLGSLRLSMSVLLRNLVAFFF